MNFDPFFLALESSALSTWIRESESLLAPPGILTLHTLAMERFFPILWLSFWINAVTGVLLLLAYPTKALTNPLFYSKLAIIGAALTLIPRLRHIVVTSDDFGGGVTRKTALVAITSVVLWAAAITAGRLLPYTYHRLLIVE